MKALFIGGSGTISLSIVKRLVDIGWEVWTLNRGNRGDELPESVKQIHVDINDEEGVKKALDGLYFDTIADFIVFDVEAAERDIRLFRGKTDQYIFISSASAYQKRERRLSFPIAVSHSGLSLGARTLPSVLPALWERKKQ